MLFGISIENWVGIVIVAAVAAYHIYITITKQWTKVREFAYKSMLLAERTLGDENGKLKFEFVARIVYKYLPLWLKPFISEEVIKKLIQRWYNRAKDFLDDGMINESV